MTVGGRRLGWPPLVWRLAVRLRSRLVVLNMHERLRRLFSVTLLGTVTIVEVSLRRMKHIRQPSTLNLLSV